MGSITVKQSDIVKIAIESYGPWWYECTLNFYAQRAAGGNIREVTIDIDDDDLPYLFNLSNVFNDETDPTVVVEDSNVIFNVEYHV